MGLRNESQTKSRKFSRVNLAYMRSYPIFKQVSFEEQLDRDFLYQALRSHRSTNYAKPIHQRLRVNVQRDGPQHLFAGLLPTLFMYDYHLQCIYRSGYVDMPSAVQRN